MLTPEQVRLRLKVAQETLDGNMATSGSEYHAIGDVIRLLGDVLPDLVAPVRPAERTESQSSDERIWRRDEDDWSLWHDLGPAGRREPRACPDCKDGQLCERARKLMEGE